MPESDELVARLRGVEARIGASALAAGRNFSEIKLVAIGKTFPGERMVPVLDAGHRCFGENRVQEARAKWPGLLEAYQGIELHLVGHLQSNKVRDALGLFNVIQSLDRPSLAEAIARELHKGARAPKLLVEVNTGEEPQKSGVLPADLEAFVSRCRNDLGLALSGLMCIPPVNEEPAVHFAFLAKRARELGLAELSMGMSADFETAVAFGATYVRVGSAIFGDRHPAAALPA
jgi:PLP dependent protein